MAPYNRMEVYEGMEVEGKYDWSLDGADDDDMTVFTHEQHMRVNGGRQGRRGFK